MRLLGESLRTLCAREWPLPRVDLLVDLEAVDDGEGLGALGALVGEGVLALDGVVT